MNYWLVKSEPDAYSWQQLLKDGETQWTGVRNYAARLHLRTMKKGDEVFFYHSNEGKEIVGIAKVSKEAYQDPTTKEDWSAVDIKPFKTLKKTVTLEEMKKEKSLKNMPLIRIPRLSVMPLTKEEFDIVLKLAS
jgi:predicted RNA-binding protein with PUA-like domain